METKGSEETRLASPSLESNEEVAGKTSTASRVSVGEGEYHSKAQESRGFSMKVICSKLATGTSSTRIPVVEGAPIDPVDDPE